MRQVGPPASRRNRVPVGGIFLAEARKNREGHGSSRECEVGTALRGGQVAGEHTVFLFGAADRLELTHRATDRDVFVHGALQAANGSQVNQKGITECNISWVCFLRISDPDN